MLEVPKLNCIYCAVCGKPFIAISGFLICQPCLEKRPKPEPALMSDADKGNLPSVPP